MRHGFETYTSHSQYNLLALTALGYAYEHSLATENSVEELMTPAEASVGILKLEAPMGLLCAQAAGTQAVILTEPKHGQNPAGLARIQFLDVASQLAQTDSLVATPLYHLPGENGHNVCAGLSWLKVASGDAVTSEHLSVADMRSDHGSCSLVDVVEMKESLKFGIEWQLSKQPIKRIAETYMLSRGCLRVDYTWDGNLSEGQVQFPVFSGDGNAKANIEVGQDSVVVAFSGSRIRYRLDGTRMPVCVHENLVSRTGTVSVFAASITGDRATLLVEVL